MPRSMRPVLSVLAATMLLAVLTTPALADDSRKSQAGETCGRSADCAGELRCINKTCVPPGTAPASTALQQSYPDRAKRKSAITFLGVGGGVAALGVGLLVGGLVVGADVQDKLDQALCQGLYSEASGKCETDYNQRSILAEEADTAQTTRDALYVSGGLVLSAGIALLVTGGVKLAQSKSSAPPRVSVSPWTDGQTLMVAQANLRF